jgi:hypothetical protein
MLEEIRSASAVECANDSVAVRFDTVEAYERVLAQWPREGGFVIVTNHQGSCDHEDERSVFLVKGLDCYNETTTVEASVDKKDIPSVSCKL